MGIPQYSQSSNTLKTDYFSRGNIYNPYESQYPEKVNSDTTQATDNFNYIPTSPEEDGSFISEYLSNGLSPTLLQKYDRELTVAASGFSVLILLTIGACLWCLLGLLKRDYDDGVKENGTSKQSRAGGGDDEDGPTDDLESSCGVSDASAEGGKGNLGRTGIGTSVASAGKKKMSMISKIFLNRNGHGTGILAKHRNIITPDKNIPFIVPTIQLPAQPQDPCRKVESSVICDEHQPQPSTSQTPASAKQALLLAQQFFPQLENPESDSCPLIAFTLFYELSTQILNVRLLEGRNFPDSVSHTVSVKIYPGRSAKQTTKEFRARSPVYNVEFCYHLRKSSLQTKVLKLKTIIPGNPKRVIGYVNVAIKDLPGFDTVSTEPTEDLKTIQLWRRVELPSEIGDGVKLQVSVKWSPEPSPGFLTLKIIEAAGLHENRDCDYSSSYVKVTLQEQGRNIKTRKTQLVRWGSVPVFDDVFVLTIPRELLTQISFLLVVIARGRLGSKAVLGKISIGPIPYSIRQSGGGRAADGVRGGVVAARGSSSSSSTSSTGTEIWEDMCHQPDTEIIRWLHLLP